MRGLQNSMLGLASRLTAGAAPKPSNDKKRFAAKFCGCGRQISANKAKCLACSGDKK